MGRAMKRAVELQLVGLLFDLGKRLISIAEAYVADDQQGDATAEPVANADSAFALRELRTLTDKTPDEIEQLERLRRGKRRRGDDK